VLINDQLFISATDTYRDSGSVGFMLVIAGNMEDEVESAVAMRNFRLSRLAD